MSEPSPLLDATTLGELFQELSFELETRGDTAEVFVVGGAAMALAYDSGRETRDVDALFAPGVTVRYLARVVARRHESMADDWLNDAVKGFMPVAQDAAPIVVFESEALIVRVASAAYLLAMKLMGGRRNRDRPDAAKLYRILGYTTAQEGLDLLEAMYPPGLLEARHRFIVEEVNEMANGVNGHVVEHLDRYRSDN